MVQNARVLLITHRVLMVGQPKGMARVAYERNFFVLYTQMRNERHKGGPPRQRSERQA